MYTVHTQREREYEWNETAAQQNRRAHAISWVAQEPLSCRLLTRCRWSLFYYLFSLGCHHLRQHSEHIGVHYLFMMFVRFETATIIAIWNSLYISSNVVCIVFFYYFSVSVSESMWLHSHWNIHSIFCLSNSNRNKKKIKAKTELLLEQVFLPSENSSLENTEVS